MLSLPIKHHVLHHQFCKVCILIKSSTLLFFVVTHLFLFISFLSLRLIHPCCSYSPVYATVVRRLSEGCGCKQSQLDCIEHNLHVLERCSISVKHRATHRYGGAIKTYKAERNNRENDSTFGKWDCNCRIPVYYLKFTTLIAFSM